MFFTLAMALWRQYNLSCYIVPRRLHESSRPRHGSEVELPIFAPPILLPSTLIESRNSVSRLEQVQIKGQRCYGLVFAADALNTHTWRRTRA